METISIWEGSRIRLRPVEPADWEFFHRWSQDDLVSRAADEIHFPESREAVKRWTERTATKGPSNDRFRWVIVTEDDVAVGTINSHSCDRRVGSFSYGVVVAPEFRGHGFAAEAIRLVLRFFFTELGYQKVSVHVYEFNSGSSRLHEALGFVREGRLRRMAFAGGRHWDTLVYGLTREEFAAGRAGTLPTFGPISAAGDEIGSAAPGIEGGR